MKTAFKKSLSLFLAFILVFGSTAAGLSSIDFSSVFEVKASAASEYTEGYYTYYVENGEATIVDVNTDISGDITVPYTLGGYPVTSIGYEAFALCKNITLISFEQKSGVKYLYPGAFGLCESLEEIIFPDSLITIGERAFYGCGNLKTVHISKSITNIEKEAFLLCEKIEKFSVDSGNNNFSTDNYGILYNKNKTKLVVYPAGSKLEHYTVPHGVKTIAAYAFFAYNTKKVFLPETIEVIEDYAFSSSSVEDINLPNSLTTIGRGSFSNSNLKSVSFGDNPSLTSIGGSAFAYCHIDYFHVPSTVKTIGELAFEGSVYKDNEYICSNTDDCYAKTYAEENNISFIVCNGHDTPNTPDKPDAPDTPDTPSNNNGFIISLDSSDVSGELEITYEETIKLSVTLPAEYAGYTVVWESSNSDIAPVVNGNITAVGEGTVTIKAYLVDASGNKVTDENGNEISQSIKLTCKLTFWQKIILFFKNLINAILSIFS